MAQWTLVVLLSVPAAAAATATVDSGCDSRDLQAIIDAWPTGASPGHGCGHLRAGDSTTITGAKTSLYNHGYEAGRKPHDEV
jgi:hypothetical protein